MSQFLGACGTVFVGVGFLCAPFAAGVTFVFYVFVRAGAPDPRAASIGIGAAAGVAAAFILVGLFHLRYRSATDVYHEQYKHLLRRLQSAQHRRAAIHVAKRSPRGQLVGSRNNMMLAAAVAGVIAYLALISVIVWTIDPKALQVAASFVTTGTLISLLHQSRWWAPGRAAWPTLASPPPACCRRRSCPA